MPCIDSKKKPYCTGLMDGLWKVIMSYRPPPQPAAHRRRGGLCASGEGASGDWSQRSVGPRRAGHTAEWRRVSVRWDEALGDAPCFYSEDPWGNRIEFIASPS